MYCLARFLDRPVWLSFGLDRPSTVCFTPADLALCRAVALSSSRFSKLSRLAVRMACITTLGSLCLVRLEMALVSISAEEFCALMRVSDTLIPALTTVGSLSVRTMRRWSSLSAPIPSSVQSAWMRVRLFLSVSSEASLLATDLSPRSTRNFWAVSLHQPLGWLRYLTSSDELAPIISGFGPRLKSL